MNAATEVFPDLTSTDMPPEKAVLALLDRALEQRASDLFLASNDGYVEARIRQHGIVRPLTLLPVALGQHCLAHLKVLAGMNIADKRRPQDGRWLYDAAAGEQVDVRICTVPTLYGEDACLRLLGRDTGRFTLEELGLIRAEQNDLLAMLNSPSGLLLVTGPTGAGKTTTLYACLQYLNNGERKINTIEDPIEYAVEGVRQSQVNFRIELGYPELLRAVLRQAPDVIMLGEIRDAITAATAVHAANSGHLVLATLHAPLAVGAVQSMRAWGVHAHFLASCLLGVVAQRLVRTLCPTCRTSFPLDSAPDTFAEVEPWLTAGEGRQLFAARGCSECDATGYAGRTGVFEVLRASQNMRQMIAQGKPIQALRAQAVRDRLIELRQAALLRVAKGQTTAEEVVRVIPPECLGLED
jgi:type II secretory ATPase GspE/PulE/Tfp pilus assembly ATPase PilB-like protein